MKKGNIETKKYHMDKRIVTIKRKKVTRQEKKGNKNIKKDNISKKEISHCFKNSNNQSKKIVTLHFKNMYQNCRKERESAL